METNFNLGSLKIVYSPLMEYFTKINDNIDENLRLVKEENKVVTNYEFIDILGKVQASLKMIGLLGVVKVLNLIQESSNELKEVKFDTNQSIQIWEMNKQLFKNVEDYIGQLLESSFDEPTQLFSQYKKLAELINKKVSVKDLFSPKLEINDVKFQQELRVGQLINDNNKKILLDNLKKSHQIVQQSLVTLLAGISKNGNFATPEEKNIHHAACKKIYDVLTQLQEQKIAKSYYILFGIQKLLVCTATPLFNDSFSGLAGEYNKELKFNLAKIEKTLKILIDEVELLENGEKTGSFKANEEIVKENLYFIIQIVEQNNKLKEMPVFKELLSYFNFDFYIKQLNNVTFNTNMAQANPELSHQLDRLLLEIKEEFMLLTAKKLSEEVFTKHIVKLYALNYKLNETLKKEEKNLKDFSTILLATIEKFKNKEIEFNEIAIKELSMSIVLLEYANNFFIKGTFNEDEKNNFILKLNLQANRLSHLLENKDVSTLANVQLDDKNKEVDERKAMLKIFEEVSKEIKIVEEILDNILRTDEDDNEELEKIFTPLNRTRGIFNILNKTSLANIVDELAKTWYQVYNDGLKAIDRNLINHSVIWLGGISLYLSAEEIDNKVEAELIEERLIQKYNEYLGKNPIQYSNTQEIDFDNLNTVSLNQEVILENKHAIETIEIKEPVKEEQSLVNLSEITQPIEIIPAHVEEQVEEVNKEVIPETEKNIHEDSAEDDSLLSVFLEEANHVQQEIEKGIQHLETNLNSQDDLANLRRAFHTLKGSGRMVGLENLGEISWELEQAFNKVIGLEVELPIELLNGTKYLFNQIKTWVKELEVNRKVIINVAEELSKFNDILSHDEEELIIEAEKVNLPMIEESILINGIMIDSNIYKLFENESEEHLKMLDTLMLHETINLSELMRHSHTLSSIAKTVNLNEFAQLSAQIEIIFNTYIEQQKIPSIEDKMLISQAIIRLNQVKKPNLNEEEKEVYEKDINQLVLLQNKLNEHEEVEDVLSVPTMIGMEDILQVPQQEESTFLNDESNVLDIPVIVSPNIEDEVPEVIQVKITQDKKDDINEEFNIKEDNSLSIVSPIHEEKEKHQINKEELEKFAESLSAHFQKTLDKTVADLNNTVHSLKEKVEENRLNLNQDDIVNDVMKKVTELVEEKHQHLLDEFKKLEETKSEETLKLFKELKDLKEGFDNLKTSNEQLQKTQKDGINNIGKDIRTLAGILKKKSNESYQDIFGDELNSQELENNELEFELDSDSLNIDEFAYSKNDETEFLKNNSYIQAIFEDSISTIEDEFEENVYSAYELEYKDISEKIRNLLEKISIDVLNLEDNDELKRYLHTLKGSARMVGFNKIGMLYHRLESLLEYSENHKISLYKIKLLIEKELEKIEFLNTPFIQKISAKDEKWLDSIDEQFSNKKVKIEVEKFFDKKESLSIEDTKEKHVITTHEQYIRMPSTVVDDLINEAGEVRLSRTTLEGTLNTNKKALSDLQNSSGKLSKYLKEIETQAEGQIAAHKDDIEIGKLFDPLEFDRFTRMQELTRSMNEAVADVKDTVNRMGSLYKTQENAIAQQSILTNNILNSLMKVRLISIRSLNDRLYQIAKRTAKELNKHVVLDLFKDNAEIDRIVLDRIQPALEHLVRNCIAHGIESPEIRKEKEKETIGKISIEVTQNANFIILKVIDDGAGINLNKVKQLGLEKGLLTEGINYSDDEIVELIFKSGFSTADSISQVSGRGIGMDFVKNEIFALGGSIKTETQKDKGTEFTIVLPVSVATNQAMLTEINEKLIAIPAVLVDQVISLKKHKLEIAYEENYIVHNQQEYPIYYLGHLMGLLPGNKNPEIKSYNTLILTSYLNQQIALHIDQIETTDEILIKPIGSILNKISGLLGTTLLGDGRQGTVINPVLLKDHFNKHINKEISNNENQNENVRPSRKEILSVMVVDDSITVRRATSKILEKYGYNIILAKDGENGLEQLQITIPDIILSDIEMPNMDGFEFVKNIKNTDKYKNIPIIMITSRTADKHRNLALSLGVDDFLGKPYQEDQLIELIKKLTKTVD